MNAISRILVVVACAAVNVLGHAVVVTPAPFNTNPSKSFGCGGASAGPLNVVAGGRGQVNWKLVAGDGAGDIRMLVDSAGGGGGAFPTSYQGTPSASITAVPLTGGSTPTVVGTTYTFDFDASAVACTGGAGGNVCTAQISSTSNWVSCFSYTKTAPAQTGSTASQAVTYQGSCVTITAGQLTTCNMLTGRVVWVPQGSDVTDLDAGVQATLVQNLPNERVFWAQPQSVDVVTPCTTAYKEYLCAQAMVPCNAAKTQPTTNIYGTQPCRSTCKEFTCWCDLNDIHAFLYDCDTISNANFDSTGYCSRKKFGPNNSTCIPRATSSTAGTCPGGECAAAPHTASHSTFALAAVVATVAAVLYAHNH